MHDLMPGKLWDRQQLRNSTELLHEIIKKLELPIYWSRTGTWATILGVKVPCKRSDQILKCLHFSKNKNNNEECRLCEVRLTFHQVSTLFTGVLE
jgi:hypothetical protein